MISRLSELGPTGGEERTIPPSGDGAARDIDAWLGVLTKLLHMPEARRHAIREELSEHLHQRCRDLVLAGATPADAVRQAIGELGATTALARRLELAHRFPKRSVIMNLSLFGLGAVVVSAAVLTMSTREPPPSPSLFEDPAVYRTPPAPLPDERITITEDMTLHQLISFVSASHDVAVTIDWGVLIEAGFEIDEPMEMSAEDLLIPHLLERLAQISPLGENIDWRYTDAGLEISTRRHFDRRETRLASYDIRHILNSAIVSEGDVTDLLLTFVSPEDWEDNGGEVARHQIVGGRLFIEAPPRMHERARWILGELAAGADAGDAGAVGARSGLPGGFGHARRAPGGGGVGIDGGGRGGSGGAGGDGGAGGRAR